MKLLFETRYMRYGINEQTTAYYRALQTYTAHFPQSPATFALFSSEKVKKKFFKERDSHFHQLVQLYSTKFPESLGLAVCLFNMANNLFRNAAIDDKYEVSNAEQYFLQADTIFSSHFSRTLDYAKFLVHFGYYKHEIKQLEQAKECYLTAYHISLAYLPLYSELVQSLQQLVKMGNLVEVEELYLKAEQVYLKSFSQSRYFPSFLNSFSEFYCQQEQYAKGLAKQSQAYQILSEHWPQSDNLFKIIPGLVSLYQGLGRSEEAEDCFFRLLSAQDRNSLYYAKCLQSMAYIYKENGKNDLAEEHYLKACEVFANFGEELHSEYLKSLAFWYKKKGRKEAEEYFIKACDVSAVCGYETYAKCLDCLADWYNENKRKDEAEESYLKAFKVYATCDEESYLESLKRRADWYSRNSRKEAEEYYLKACDVSAVCGEHSNFYCLDSVARWYEMKGRNDLAEKYFLEACNVAAVCGKEVYAYSLKSLAVYYSMNHKIAETEEYYLKVCDAASTCGKKFYVDCLKSLAKWFSDNDRDEESEAYYLKACDVAATCGIEFYARYLVFLAYWYEEKKIDDAAYEYYSKACEVAAVCGGEFYACYLMFLAEYLCRENERAEAKEYALKALEVFDACGETSRRYPQCLALLAQCSHENEEAEIYYLKACYFMVDIYESFYKEYIANWYAKIGRAEASEVCYIKYYQTFSTEFSSSDLRDLYQ